MSPNSLPPSSASP